MSATDRIVLLPDRRGWPGAGGNRHRYAYNVDTQQNGDAGGARALADGPPLPHRSFLDVEGSCTKYVGMPRWVGYKWGLVVM